MTGESYYEGLTGKSSQKENSSETYRYKYDMIVDSPDSSFWQAVYDTAQEWAKKNDAVLDFNLAGKVVLIGYYSSDDILTAVEKGVISVTCDVDTEQLGRYSIEALTEYQKVVKGLVLLAAVIFDVVSKRKSFIVK